MNSGSAKQNFGFFPFPGKRTERKAGNKKETPSGFTLLEVMVTVAIIGVLTTLAVGGIKNLLPRFRVNDAVRQIRGDMQKCKMAAVRNNTECLMVFVEGNATGGGGEYTACFSVDSSCSGDTEVLTGDLNGENHVGVWMDDVWFTNGDHFRFNSRGMPLSDSGGFSAGHVNCTNKNGDVRAVKVSKTGRIRVKD